MTDQPTLRGGIRAVVLAFVTLASAAVGTAGSLEQLAAEMGKTRLLGGNHVELQHSQYHTSLYNSPFSLGPLSNLHQWQIHHPLPKHVA